MGKNNATLTVIVLAVNETTSLKRVINKILSFSFVSKIIIISPKFVSNGCISTQKKLIESNKNIESSIQPHNYPGIGGAVKYGATLVKTKYFTWVDGDGETDPKYLEEMFKIVEKNEKYDFINASRFKGGDIIIKDYGFFSSLFTFHFQILCRLFFSKDITDFTVSYRIYKTSFFNSFEFKSNNQNFALESILTPLITGKVYFKEVFYQWTKRVEGETNNTFINKLSYFKIFFLSLLKKYKIL